LSKDVKEVGSYRSQSSRGLAKLGQNPILPEFQQFNVELSPKPAQIAVKKRKAKGIDRPENEGKKLKMRNRTSVVQKILI
jgi:hypothetical protein